MLRTTHRGGSVLNQVSTLYNGFGQPVTEYQSHGGTVNTSTTPKTQYGYASGSANTIRPTSQTYPNGRVLSSSYGTTGSIDDAASRVSALVDSVGGTTLVSYSYLGRGSFVVASEPQPNLQWTLASLTGSNDPDTGDIYTGLDRFGRVKDNRWYNNGTSSDVDRIQYGYDRASNRIWRFNAVATGQGKAFDELYKYDGVQRLKDMARGTLNGTKTALTTSTFGQCWTLDATGNWSGFREDSDGNGTWDLVQSRTANKVNEITGVTNSTGAAWATPVYSAAGNMTTIPRGTQAGSKNWSGLSVDDWSGLSTDDWSAMPVNASSGATSFTATYDAWNRLIKLIDPESGVTIQRNTYDARRFRIVREDLGQPARHFYYNTGWQCLEERASSSPDAAVPDRQFVWGLRYIDELVLRDRDTDGNGSLNERLYALQDANWNVTALVDTTGTVQERYAYSAYGVPVFLTPTFSSRSGSDFGAEHRYCGYRWDLSATMYKVRNRVYSPAVGTWQQRDPIGLLVVGLNPTVYVASVPTLLSDPTGLKHCIFTMHDKGAQERWDADAIRLWESLRTPATVLLGVKQPSLIPAVIRSSGCCSVTLIGHRGGLTNPGIVTSTERVFPDAYLAVQIGNAMRTNGCGGNCSIRVFSCQLCNASPQRCERFHVPPQELPKQDVAEQTAWQQTASLTGCKITVPTHILAIGFPTVDDPAVVNTCLPNGCTIPHPIYPDDELRLIPPTTRNFFPRNSRR